MVLRDYVALIRTYWAAFTACAVVVLGLALLPVVLKPDTYQAHTEFAVSVAAPDATVEELSWAESLSSSIANNIAETGSTTKVLSAATAKLSPEMSADSLLRKVEVTSTADSPLVRVVAFDTSPDIASEVATQVAAELRSVAQEVADHMVDGTDKAAEIELSAVADAAVPSAPLAKGITKALLLGLFGGSFVGVLAIILIHRVRARFILPSDFSTLTLTPVLAVIEAPKRPTESLAVESAPRSEAALKYRFLACRLTELASERDALILIDLSTSTDAAVTKQNVDLALTMSGHAEATQEITPGPWSVARPICWTRGTQELAATDLSGFEQVGVVFVVPIGAQLSHLEVARNLIDTSPYEFCGTIVDRSHTTHTRAPETSATR